MATKKNTTSKAAATAAANKQANSATVTKAAAKGSVKSKKESYENFSFDQLKQVNNYFKQQSLFRVLDALNKHSFVWAKFGHKLTIDDLKAAAPDYFFEKKKGVMVERRQFQAWKFLMALRKIRPADLQALVASLQKFRETADVE